MTPQNIIPQSFKAFNEGIKKMSDEKMDKALKGKDIITLKYDPITSMHLGKIGDVFITSDKEFMHIERNRKSEIAVLDLGLEEV